MLESFDDSFFCQEQDDFGFNLLQILSFHYLTDPYRFKIQFTQNLLLFYPFISAFFGY